MKQGAQRELKCQANHLSNFSELQFNILERQEASLCRRSRIAMKFWPEEIAPKYDCRRAIYL